MALRVNLVIPKACRTTQCTAFLGTEVHSFEVPSTRPVSLLCLSDEEILKLVFSSSTDEIWTIQGTLKSLVGKNRQRLTLESKVAGESYWLDFNIDLAYPQEPTCPQCAVWRRAAEAMQRDSTLSPQLLQDLEPVQLGRIRTALPHTLVEQDDAHLKTLLSHASEQEKVTEILQSEVDRLNALVKELLERPEIPVVTAKCTHCEELRTAKLAMEGELAAARLRLQEQTARTAESEARLQLLSADLKIASAQVKNAERISSELQRLRNLLSVSEDQRMTLLRDMVKSQAEWKIRLSEAHDDLQKMTTERDKCMTDVETANAALADTKTQLTRLQAKWEEEERIRQERRAAPRVEALQLSQRVEEFAHLNESLLLDKAQLQSALDILEEQLQEREIEVTGLRKELQQGKNVSEELSFLKSQLAAYDEASRALKTQLSNELPQLVQLLAAGKDNRKLEDKIQAQERELAQLRGTVAQPRPTSPLYRPESGDAVDQTLAHYLNSRGSPLAVPFQRKDPGVYQFGSKRVFLRVENGVIVVRVGGGYMNIEEFLAVYTPMELGKVQSVFQAAQDLEGKLEEGRFVTCIGVRKSTSK